MYLINLNAEQKRLFSLLPHPENWILICTTRVTKEAVRKAGRILRRVLQGHGSY